MASEGNLQKLEFLRKRKKAQHEIDKENSKLIA